MKSHVTRFGTLEKFVKEASSLWVDHKGIDYLVDDLDRVMEALVKKAEDLAREDRRRTIMKRDFEQAFSVFLTGAEDPDAIFRKISSMDIPRLAKLIKLVKEELKE